jgi:uncharacterized protein YheU (UPF0270 family)
MAWHPSSKTRQIPCACRPDTDNIRNPLSEDEIMIIPWQELEPDTLTNLLEHFVLQEGTEYGEQDVSLTDKVEAVRQQLLQGSAVLVYSELHESVNVVPKTHLSKSPTDDFPKRSAVTAYRAAHPALPIQLAPSGRMASSPSSSTYSNVPRAQGSPRSPLLPGSVVAAGG